VPLPAKDELFKLYKVSKRKDLDISTFSAAIWMRLKAGTIVDARLAYGGVGPTIVRLRQTEQQLRGRAMSGETMAAVNEIVQSEISTISDVRGSAEYRRLLAGNVLRRLSAELACVDGSGNGSPSQYSRRGQGGGRSG
jgi:xanthine dehydrogenase small subunit